MSKKYESKTKVPSKKAGAKRKPSSKWSPSIKRTGAIAYSKWGASSSSSSSSSSMAPPRSAPTKLLKGAYAISEQLRNQLLAIPMYVPDPDFSGLSLKERKEVKPEVLVPLIEHPGKDMVLNPDRESFRRSMRMVLMGTNSPKTVYRQVLATSVQLFSNAAGQVNAAIAVNSVTLVNEWASWTALFDEFFVLKMVCKWQPVSRYSPIPGTITTSGSQRNYNIPLFCTSIQHGAPFATTEAGTAENPTTRLNSTGDPWKFSWTNVENWRTVGAPQVSETGTIPTQGWALTAASATSAYTGAVQFLAIPATGLTPTNQVGSFFIQYHVLFRCRQ